MLKLVKPVDQIEKGKFRVAMPLVITVRKLILSKFQQGQI